MKTIFKIIIIGILAWYTQNSYIEFKKNPMFNIVDVDIFAKNKELVNNLLESGKKLKGKNILEVDIDKIKNKILEDVRINDVTVIKKIPDSIYIKINEKNPFTYIEYKGIIYISDENGTVYGKMRESEKYNMPILRISEEKDVKDFIKILKKIKYIDSISQVYRKKNSIVLTINTGLLIITDEKVKNKKYEIVEKLYEQERFNGKPIEYIDLRFDNYIIKRKEGDHK